MFEGKILKKIFGPKRNSGEDHEIKNKEKLKGLYDEATVVGTLKSV